MFTLFMSYLLSILFETPSIVLLVSRMSNPLHYHRSMPDIVCTIRVQVDAHRVFICLFMFMCYRFACIIYLCVLFICMLIICLCVNYLFHLIFLGDSCGFPSDFWLL